MVVVIALGITWLLDGLEVTLAGSLAPVLKHPQALGLSDTEVGASATAYLAGAVIGALVFGYATDRLGRKKLFLFTLALYLTATAATAFSWNFWSFFMFRFFTGTGIGGEYAAINSAIDELIPGRVRGHVDLVINATFWIGASLGSVGSLVLLQGGFFPPNLAWRFAFGIGAALGLGILAMRRSVPESPRWLMLRGYEKEAEDIVGNVERRVRESGAELPEPEGELELQVRDHTPFGDIWKHMAHDQRGRSCLGLSLMIAQSFFYNAVFFTYGLVLVKFYRVKAEAVAWYILALALGNFVGPLILGRLFDTVGRKPMIVSTYGISGILLVLTSFTFLEDLLSARLQTAVFAVIFFIASSAASAAYLTVSEVFPLEIRALAISIFYSAGTLAGGVGAPILFGTLIDSGSRSHLFWGYLLGASLMIGAAVAELFLGVAAERQSLEKISTPLASRSG